MIPNYSFLWSDINIDAWKKVGERLDTDIKGCSEIIKGATSYIVQYQAGIYARVDYKDYI